jgi:hypothetical protein
MHIYCIYVYISCLYMYIHCTWVPNMHIHCTYCDHVYSCTYTVLGHPILHAYTTQATVDGLLCFCSIWSGIKKKSPSSGQGLPPSISSCAADSQGLGMSLTPASASLCPPQKPVKTTGYSMYIHCIYMYLHGSYMYILCT